MIVVASGLERIIVCNTCKDEHQENMDGCTGYCGNNVEIDVKHGTNNQPIFNLLPNNKIFRPVQIQSTCR